MLDRCGISVLGFARCCWFGYACGCCCVFVGYGALAMLVLIVLCWFLVAAWYGLCVLLWIVVCLLVVFVFVLVL